MLTVMLQLLQVFRSWNRPVVVARHVRVMSSSPPRGLRLCPGANAIQWMLAMGLRYGLHDDMWIPGKPLYIGTRDSFGLMALVFGPASSWMPWG